MFTIILMRSLNNIYFITWYIDKLTTLQGYDYYKVKVQGEMTNHNVLQTCKNVGLRASCEANDSYRDSNCFWDTSLPQGTIINILTKAICQIGQYEYLSCARLNNLCYYMANTHFSIGIIDGKFRWTTNGDYGFWALCVKTNNSK